ncbi:MAG TPA: orotidine-5'-phosphate decarboxylase [Candidatus Saccharimonadales bacterium]|nr:orotidine-5'-phosphate decarboxylase [Candidatus Saccharimonadales bacterium]
MMQAKDKFFVAIDVGTIDEAKRLMDSLVDLVTHVKVGLQLATRSSWGEAVAAAHERGFRVFCDTKFKDIPNTMEQASFALTQHKPEFFTVMSDNSQAALEAVRRGVDKAAEGLKLVEKPKIIGVAMLTSISPEEGREIYGGNLQEKALQFAGNAADAGLEALVCSPEEIGLFRSQPKLNDVIIVTPGVRPAWAAAHDQQRFATPAEAIKKGADMLVIGRPITQPPSEIGSTQEAIKRIIGEIEEVL